MNRKHALVIAVALGVAAVAGTLAAIQSTSLGAEAATVSEAQIERRTKALDRAAAQLRRQARRKPPALPAMPSSRGGGLSASASSGPGPAPTAVLVASGPGPSSGSGGSHHDDRADDHHDDDHHELEHRDDDGHHGRGRGRGRGGDDDRRDDD